MEREWAGQNQTEMTFGIQDPATKLSVEKDEQKFEITFTLERVTSWTRDCDNEKVMNFQMPFLSEQSAVQGQQCILHTICALFGIAGTQNENQIFKANLFLRDTGQTSLFLL